MGSVKLTRFIPPLRVVMTLALMSVLLLSLVIYYRAIRIQRVSELALAIYQPQNDFSQNMIGPFIKLFDKKKISSIRFTANSLCIDESLLLMVAPNSEDTQPTILKDLGKIFHAILQDPELRSNIELILVSTIGPVSPGMSLSIKNYRILQAKSESVLRSLFIAEPELEQKYSSFFASTVISATDAERDQCAVEFRFIPNDRLYIEYLQRVQI